LAKTSQFAFVLKPVSVPVTVPCAGRLTIHSGRPYKSKQYYCTFCRKT